MIDGESVDEILGTFPTILPHHETHAGDPRPSERSFVRIKGQAGNGETAMPAHFPYDDNNEALHPSVTVDLDGKSDKTSQPPVNSARKDATAQAVEIYSTQPPKQDFDERIDHLQAQIHALERKKKERVPYQWKVIHRVPDPGASKRSTSEGWIAYLDQPRWKRGVVGNLPLAGTEPISDMQSYLERHSELAFVVYREYGPEDPVGCHVSTVGERDRRSLEEGFPAPTAECLRLVSRDLIKAMHEFSKSLPSRHGIEWGYPFDEGHLIAAPYLLIYFHQEAFSQMTAKLPKPVQHQWEMLKSYVYQAFGAEYDEVRKHFQQGLVAPRFVKYLFRPGDVLRVDDGSSTDAVQALDVVKQLTKAAAQNKRPEDVSRDSGDSDDEDYRKGKDYKSFHWLIRAQYYTFHSWFDLADRTFAIDLPASHEPVPINHLDLYPMDYATPQLQKTLEDRGKSYWKCRHRRFVEYSKGSSLPAWSGIKSRYMIDPVTYIKMHGRPDVGPRGAAEDAAEGDIIDREECPDYPFPILLPRTIKGYNFVEKAWLDVDVEFISDVKWNFKAFENLVLDEETKDILEALVTHQLATEASTDLIEGKGNGLIILLHGGPGTGKTYTAESVADYAQKPLYRVTCGDIGTEPVNVEKYLETVLRLGRIWNCVILLDEADVFLEERSLNDLQRNALVSVFLRVLEYYNGILILTTNRVGHFDEAFRSRIQLALHYKSLDADQRKQIWTNFIKNLKASGTCEIDFDDLVMHVRDLSEFEMNGRQIRNVITTARQLAEFRKKSLNFEILKKVILITGRFDKYLQDVKRVEQVKNGTVDDEIARDFGNR